MFFFATRLYSLFELKAVPNRSENVRNRFLTNFYIETVIQKNPTFFFHRKKICKFWILKNFIIENFQNFHHRKFFNIFIITKFDFFSMKKKSTKIFFHFWKLFFFDEKKSWDKNWIIISDVEFCQESIFRIPEAI